METKKKIKVKIATVAGYICLLAVMVSVFPVVLPMIFGYTPYLCGTDTTGQIFKYGSIVYTKDIDLSQYGAGTLAAVESESGKAHTVDVYYVDSNSDNTLQLRDGSSVSYDAVKGNVKAQTPIVGYFCMFSFSAYGIVIEVVVLAAGVALTIYANKLSKETAKQERK